MNDNGISITGGARVGWVNATWPFAKLVASKNRLDLNASLIGRYSFTPDQIVAINKYTAIPLLGRGVKIEHNVADYPKNIIFWCFGNPDNLIHKINEVGFLPRAEPGSMPHRQGMPVSWQAIVVLIILWNLLLISDEAAVGWPSFLAVFLLFSGSVAIWRVSWLQRCILKPGRHPNEIKAWLHLFTMIGGILSFFMLFSLMFGVP